MRLTLLLLFLLCSCNLQRNIEYFDFKWKKRAILLPVKFSNKKVTYLQLDTGSPKSYIKYCLSELQKMSKLKNDVSKTHAVTIGKNQFEVNFKYFNTRKKFDCDLIWDNGPIGTIGVSSLKSKVLILDFLNSKFAVTSNSIISNSLKKKNIKWINVILKNNRLLVPVKSHTGESYNFMYDTGGGEFDIIVEEKKWEKLTGQSKLNESNSISKVWSWDKYVEIITNRANGSLYLSGHEIKSSRISFVNDNSKNFKFSSYATKLDGIISNSLFEKDYVVILDFVNERLGLMKNN